MLRFTYEAFRPGGHAGLFLSGLRMQRYRPSATLGLSMRHIAAAFNDLHWQHQEQTELARRAMISLRQCPGIRDTASRGDSLFEAASKVQHTSSQPSLQR